MNTSENFTNSACPSIQQVGLLIFNNLFTFVFSSASIYLSTILFQLIYKCFGLYHVNVRLLLLHFCAANGLTSLTIIARILYNFYLVLFGMDAIVMNQLQCFGFDTMYPVCNCAALISISAIGFERFYSTVIQKFTDPDKSNKKFQFLAASIWLAAGCDAAVNYSSIILSTDNASMCYCFSAGALPYYRLIVVLSFFISIQCATFASFIYVQVKNKIVSKNLYNISKFTLQQRYQISNNISTTTALLPNIISNAILYIFVCSAYFFVWPPFWDGQVELAVHYLSGINLLISFACFLQPVLLLRFNRNLRKVVFRQYKMMKKLKRLLAKRKNNRSTPVISILKSTVVSYRVTPDKSKEILEDMWTKYPSA